MNFFDMLLQHATQRSFIVALLAFKISDIAVTGFDMATDVYLVDMPCQVPLEGCIIITLVTGEIPYVSGFDMIYQAVLPRGIIVAFFVFVVVTHCFFMNSSDMPLQIAPMGCFVIALITGKIPYIDVNAFDMMCQFIPPRGTIVTCLTFVAISLFVNSSNMPLQIVSLWCFVITLITGNIIYLVMN